MKGTIGAHECNGGLEIQPSDIDDNLGGKGEDGFGWITWRRRVIDMVIEVGIGKAKLVVHAVERDETVLVVVQVLVSVLVLVLV